MKSRRLANSRGSAYQPDLKRRRRLPRFNGEWLRNRIPGARTPRSRSGTIGQKTSRGELGIPSSVVHTASNRRSQHCLPDRRLTCQFR
jgi:hypothetical protein